MLSLQNREQLAETRRCGATPIIGRKLKNVSSEQSIQMADVITGSLGCSTQNESLRSGSEALDAYKRVSPGRQAQMDMISPYVSGGGGLASIILWWGSNSGGGSGGAEGLSGDGEADMASMATWVIKTPSAAEITTAERTPEDVAKAIQDHLICIEMFLAALVHVFVFWHSEYSPQAVIAHTRAMNQTVKWRKRLGRKGGANPYYFWMMAEAVAKRDNASRSLVEVELSILGGGSGSGCASGWFIVQLWHGCHGLFSVLSRG